MTIDDQTKRLLMARRSLAFYAHSHLSGPTAPPYNGRFIVSAHHKEWSDLVNKYPNLCINAPRDHGKCKPAGTLVQSADGRRVPVEMWTGGQVVSLNDQTLKLEIHTASPAIPNGKRECIYIRTATGRELVATANEPTRTFNGWIPLECVVKGTLIAAPRHLAVFGTKKDPGAWNSGFILGMAHKNGDWSQGIEADVMQLTRDDLIDWMSGYMDAALMFRGATWDLGYIFSTDRDFLKDIQSLLSRFGVIGTMSYSAGIQGTSHGQRGWTVSIAGDSLWRLSQTMKLRTPNGITLSHIGAKAQYSAGSKRYDIYPPEIRHTIKTSYYTLRAHLGFAPSKTAAMTRAQAKKIAAIEHSDEFLRHYNADIFWDQVVEVKPLGKIPVFSITVPGPENYVANDLITHNSYFFSLAYPIWSLDKKPGAKAMIFSATLDQAERLLNDIKTEIESNQLLAHLRPKKDGKWAKRHVELGNGSVLYARGYGSKIRGFHPDIIICDDVLNDEDGRSETQRQKNIDYFYSAITPALIPGGQMIVVGCVTGDTLVPTEQGIVKIGSLAGASTAQTYFDLKLNVAGLDGTRTTSKFWNNGVCTTKRIELHNGLKLEGSFRHPVRVLLPDGNTIWRRLDELAVGDYVATRAGQLWGTDTALSIDEAYLMGQWIGDGSAEKTGRLTLTSTDAETHAFLRSRQWISQADGIHWRKSDKATMERWKELGCKFVTAPYKSVPDIIWRSPKDRVAAFLSGLFDADGCASGMLMLASTSEKLIAEVQQLLLNFGIYSNKTKSTKLAASMRVKNPKHICHKLLIPKEDAVLFKRKIGFRLTRKQQLLPDVCDSERSLPFTQNLVQELRRAKPRRPRGKISTLPPFNFAGRDFGLRQFKEIVTWFKLHGAHGHAVQVADEYIRLHEAGIYFVPVKEITDGQAHTYDFVIEGDHSFVSNGIVSHNTPFSAHDLYADLAKNSNFVFKSYPAIQNFGSKNEIALWPDRYSIDMLRKKQANGSLRFAREYLCQPMSDDAALFPASLFNGEGMALPYATLGMPLADWRALGVDTVYMGVDFGLSTRSGEDADSTVIWVTGVDKYKNRYIMDIFERDGMGFMEQKSWIEHYARKYRVGLIFVESNQAQRIFGDELIRTTDLPVKHFVTGAEKSSLEKGIPWLRTMLEQRKYRIPRGSEDTERVINKWIDQMHNFTFDKGKIINTARHDDLAMACYICERAVVEGGFGFAFGADEEDAAADMAEQAAQREVEEKLAAGLDMYDDLPMIVGNRKAGFHKISDSEAPNSVKLEARSYEEVRPRESDLFWWPPGVPRPK